MVLFYGMRGRNIAGNRSFSHCSRGCFDRDFLQNRDIPFTFLLLSLAAFLTPEGFSQFKNQREKKNQKRDITLPNSSSWVNFAAVWFTVVFSFKFHGPLRPLHLWYYCDSFFSGLCLSRADIFDCILPTTRSNTPKSLVVFRLSLTCLGVPIQGKCAKAKTALA